MSTKYPVYIAFVDYEKAFDTVEMNALWNALQEQGVNSKLIAVLRLFYANARSVVQLGEAKVSINIKRGVRQGDPLSPKLFTATLEHIFRRLDWTAYGL